MTAVVEVKSIMSYTLGVNSKTHQSATQLSYRLIAARADLRPLRILESRELSWGDWNVRIHVLGASHAVELRLKDVWVTELLTCAKDSHSEESLLSLAANAATTGCARGPGILCRVSLEPLSLALGDDLEGEFPADCRLDVAFPGGGATAPITRIGWRTAGPMFIVNTVHSYPEESCVVRSATVFEREESAS